MRHWLACIFCGLVTLLAAQTPAPDTVNLAEAEVQAVRFQRYGAGTRSVDYDLTDRPDLQSRTLANWMRAQSAVTVKGYGPAGLNTLSVRGAGASQTAVVWQGFNLQSTMNGTHDLALLPTFFLDEAILQHGPASALYGSGTAGGALHLSANPSFDQKIGVRGLVSGGSFGSRSSGAQLNFATKSWASDTRVYGQRQTNDFTYRNIAKAGSPEETLTNSAFEQWGVQHQDWFLIGKRNRLDVGLLHVQTDREIPPTMLQPASEAAQLDENTRAFFDWVYCGKKWSVHLKGGWMEEVIDYRDPLINLNAYNQATNWVAMPSAQFTLNANHHVEVGGQLLYSEAVADGYPDGHDLLEWSLFAAYRWVWFKIPLVVNVTARQAWRDDQRLPVVPTLGASYQISDDFIIRGQVARAYRMPTLNDLYWEPGGNPDLLAEHGWSEEVGFDWVLSSDKKPWSVALEATGFHQRLQNQIIWQPGSSFWSPENVGLVRTVGMESILKAAFQRKHWTVECSVSGQWINARDITKGSPVPLAYTPDGRIAGEVAIGWKDFEFRYVHQWTSTRVVSNASGSTLPAFRTADLILNGKFHLGKHVVQAFAAVNNVTNTSYQTVAWRPMPGIYGTVGIQYLFEKLKNQ